MKLLMLEYRYIHYYSFFNIRFSFVFRRVPYAPQQAVVMLFVLEAAITVRTSAPFFPVSHRKGLDLAALSSASNGFHISKDPTRISPCHILPSASCSLFLFLSRSFSLSPCLVNCPLPHYKLLTLKASFVFCFPHI